MSVTKTPLKVLVLGSNGQVGQAMQEMSRNGAFPLCEFIWWTRKDLDLSSPNRKIWVALNETQDFDVLLNLAAYTNVESAEESPLNEKINYLGVSSLSDWCSAHEKKLIHISTDYVFDGSEGKKTILSPCSPLNAYGREKRAGECHLQIHSQNYCIIRTSSVYSEYGKNFAITMFDRFSKGLETNVTGSQWMCPTYAGNLCLAIYKVVIEDIKGIQHYNDGEYMSWWDFAKKIAKRFDSYTLNKVESFPSKVKRPTHSHLIVEKCLSDVKQYPQYLTMNQSLPKIEESL